MRWLTRRRRMGMWAANVVGLLSMSGVAVAELCEGPALLEFERCADSESQGN